MSWSASRYVLPIVAVLALAAWGITNLAALGSEADGLRVVAEVNSEPITSGEFEFRTAEHRVDTMRYFHEKYGADTNRDDFWTQDFGEENPLTVLRKRTLDDLVRIKVQQMLAREAGLIDDISHAAFLKRLQEENKTRADRVARQEVIFGPQQYTEQTYFNYTLNLLVLDLKRSLAGSRIPQSDQDLVTYYESVKATRFKIPDTLAVRGLSIQYSSGFSQDRARQEAELAHTRFTGADLGDDPAKQNGRNFIYWEGTFASASRRADLQLHETLLNGLAQLAIGQVSAPIHETDKRSFTVAVVTDRIDHGFEAFESVKEAVRLRHVDDRYDQLVDEEVKRSTVVIHDTAIP